MESLGSYFREVPDYRVVNRCDHLLSDILALALIGVIADCDNFSEISDYCNDYIEVLRSDFGLILAHGIPSEDTFERVFKRLETSGLERAYKLFLGELSLEGKHISLDGKELRSTIERGKKHASVQMVNLWVHEAGLSFAQHKVEEKSNEITAIPKLLESVACKGAVVSIDAIACQKDIVATIRAQEADYLIAIKANQKSIFEQAQQEFAIEKTVLPCYETLEKGHGRIEKRIAYVSHDLKWMENRSDWQDFNSLIIIERTRCANETETTSISFYMSSLVQPSPQDSLKYVREHWGIENNLHWQLDFTFREDNAILSNDIAIQNLHLIRKWALLLLKKIPDKMSAKRKRKKIARNIKLFAHIFP